MSFHSPLRVIVLSPNFHGKKYLVYRWLENGNLRKGHLGYGLLVRICGRAHRMVKKNARLIPKQHFLALRPGF